MRLTRPSSGLYSVHRSVIRADRIHDLLTPDRGCTGGALAGDRPVDDLLAGNPLVDTLLTRATLTGAR